MLCWNAPFIKIFEPEWWSDIAEIYDIDDMSDKERFILLMGSIDYDSIFTSNPIC